MSNEKQAGLLDSPKDELAPDVWQKDQTLRPEIKKQLYDRIHQIIDPEKVKHMFVIGSITGYKYSDKSDIDVNVSIKPFDHSIAKTHLTKSINGKVAKGTKHPINFFLSEWRDDTIENYSEVPWGVYSVPQERWVSTPGNPESVRDPQDEFKFELVLARSAARRWNKYIEDWQEDAKEYRKMKRKIDNPHDPRLISQKEEIKMGRKRLKDIVRNLDANRKMSYAVGWGVPRSTEQNIIYKYIEHGKHSRLFKKLKKEVDQENLEDASRSKSKKQ